MDPKVSDSETESRPESPSPSVSSENVAVKAELDAHEEWKLQHSDGLGFDMDDGGDGDDKTHCGAQPRDPSGAGREGHLQSDWRTAVQVMSRVTHTHTHTQPVTITTTTHTNTPTSEGLD